MFVSLALLALSWRACWMGWLYVGWGATGALPRTSESLFRGVIFATA